MDSDSTYNVKGIIILDYRYHNIILVPLMYVHAKVEEVSQIYLLHYKMPEEYILKLVLKVNKPFLETEAIPGVLESVWTLEDYCELKK